MAHVGTRRSLNGKAKAACVALVEEMAGFWSLCEKRRFLKCVGTCLNKSELATWANRVGIEECGPIMMAVYNPEPVHRLISASKVNPSQLIREISQLLGKDDAAKLEFLRASRLHSPELEAYLLPKLAEKTLRDNIISVCHHFGLELPVYLRRLSFPNKLLKWKKDFARQRITERDLITLIDAITGDDNQMRSMAVEGSLPREASYKAMSRYFGPERPSPRRFEDKLACWEVHNSLHQRRWPIVDVAKGNQEWEAMLQSNPSVLHMVHRLTNNGAFTVRPAFFLVAIPKGSKFFLLCCLSTDQDWRPGFANLLRDVTVVTHANQVTASILRDTFKLDRVKCVTSTTTPSSTINLCAVAKRASLKYCPARVESPTFTDDDIDVSHIQHAAAELHLVNISQ